jgi:hypothetical protein
MLRRGIDPNSAMAHEWQVRAQSVEHLAAMTRMLEDHQRRAAERTRMIDEMLDMLLNRGWRERSNLPIPADSPQPSRSKLPIPYGG